MNVREIENILNTGNLTYKQATDEWDGYYDGFDCFHNSYCKKEDFEWAGYRFKFIDLGPELDNEEASYCAIYEIGEEFFSFSGSSSSWNDEGSLGDFIIYKVEPTEVTKTIYRKIEE